MSKERVVVKFAQSWRGYSKGELAGFDAAQAEALIKGGVAEQVEGGKGARKGTAKDTAVKAPAAPTETQSGGADTPPADDDEAKP